VSATNGFFDKLADGASGTVRVIGHVTAWSALALVLLVAFNVLARYLFGVGSVALQEGEWHLMMISALFGMSYGLNQAGEVRVDVLYGRMPARVKTVIDLVSHVALFVVALIIARLSLAYVQSSYAIGEGSPDPGGLGSRYLLKAVIPVAFVLLALQAFAMTLHAATRLRRSPPEPKR
jgi:TRAP-type mannitol/chloroaromatic compound transport system permease small subunit